MDDADRTAERMEVEARARLTQRKPIGPVATGRCLWCDDVVGDGVRWCCAACRDEWSKSCES